MSFKDELNNYIEELNCSITEFADASDLSVTTIERYILGERTPKPYSEQFFKVVNGIKKLHKESTETSEIINTLSKDFPNIDFESFANNFDKLILAVNVNIKELSEEIGYDPSFISRIRNASRKPSDLYGFIQHVANYVCKHFQNSEEKEEISLLTNCQINDLSDNEKYIDTISDYLISNNNQSDMQKFLKLLDNFDLNDYIGYDFNKIKVPTSPIILKNSKTFYGPERKKKSRIRIFKNNSFIEIK